jgi:hypothetical protein
VGGGEELVIIPHGGEPALPCQGDTRLVGIGVGYSHDARIDLVLEKGGGRHLKDFVTECAPVDQGNIY